MKNDWLRFYFSFDGRATRYDFNVRFAVVAFLGSIAAGLLDFFLINGSALTPEFREPISNIWSLLVFVSMFAVTCRRLHDMNYSGWWQLLAHGFTAVFVMILVMTVGVAALVNPLIGGLGGIVALLGIMIFYLVFFIFVSMKRGTKGPNKYGDDLLEGLQHVGQ